jgi:translation initiation factor eIF-2B subunit delta
LVKLGIECDYVLLSGASYKMAEVTKVIMGCDGMMSNGMFVVVVVSTTHVNCVIGACFARAGTAAIAMLASAQHVPVIVLCET